MLFRWLRRLLSGPAVPARPAPARAPVAGDDARDGFSGALGMATLSIPAPVPFEQLERIDREWNAWLFDYPEQTGPALNDAETRVLDTLGALLASQQPGAALVRRMPGLVPQMMHSLRGANFPGGALARTVSADAALATAVMRLASSLRPGAGTAAATATATAGIEHVMALVGPEGLRRLAAGVALRPVIDANSGLYTRRMAPRLWEHAERCAASARQLAAEMGVDPFDALLAGLLHNSGQVAALRIMDQVARGERRLGAAPFLAQLARQARALSCAIAREWRFPETVAQALDEQGEPQRGAPMSPLGRLLKLTGYLGKVRLLVEGGLLDESDAALFAGLPPNAARCYSALAASRESSPGA